MNQVESGVDYDRLKQTLRETLELESLKRLRLEPSQVETGSKLGNGHFGDVFRATLTTRPSLVKPTKITVALKKLRPLGDPDQKLRVVVALAREIVVWSPFKHPNVLGLLGFYCDDVDYTYACAVMELGVHGDIMTYARKKKANRGRRLVLAHDVASGLAYLHSLKPSVCHGDIKPDNTLVNALEKAMICDFGLTKRLENGTEGLATTSQPFTALYASPEVRQDPSIRTLPSDVWSFGCLAYQLVNDKVPYSDLPLAAKFAQASKPHPPANLGDTSSLTGLNYFLNRCWATNPKARLSMRQCQRAMFRIGPHYKEVSDWFKGDLLYRDLHDLPYDQMVEWRALYNPDLDRTLEVKAIDSLIFTSSNYVKAFGVSPDGEFVVIGNQRSITSYKVSTMTAHKTLVLPRHVDVIQISCSQSGETVAFGTTRDLFVSDFAHIYKIPERSSSSSQCPWKMRFLDEDRHLMVSWLHNEQTHAVFQLGNGISAVSTAYTAQVSAVVASSPRHAVAVVTGPGDRVALIGVAGDILQELPDCNRATFTPDGLGLVTYNALIGRPTVWKFSSSTKEDLARAPFLLPPTSLRGRFVEAGVIQGPKMIAFINMSVSSDGSLGCGVYWENKEFLGVQVWSLATRKTLQVFSFSPKVTIDSSQISVYLRPASNATSGHIDVYSWAAGAGHYKGFAIEYDSTAISMTAAD